MAVAQWGSEICNGLSINAPYEAEAETDRHMQGKDRQIEVESWNVQVYVYI